MLHRVRFFPNIKSNHIRSFQLTNRILSIDTYRKYGIAYKSRVASIKKLEMIDYTHELDGKKQYTNIVPNLYIDLSNIIDDMISLSKNGTDITSMLKCLIDDIDSFDKKIKLDHKKHKYFVELKNYIDECINLELFRETDEYIILDMIVKYGQIYSNNEMRKMIRIYHDCMHYINKSIDDSDLCILNMYIGRIIHGRELNKYTIDSIRNKVKYKFRHEENCDHKLNNLSDSWNKFTSLSDSDKRNTIRVTENNVVYLLEDYMRGIINVNDICKLVLMIELNNCTQFFEEKYKFVYKNLKNIVDVKIDFK